MSIGNFDGSLDELVTAFSNVATDPTLERSVAPSLEA